MITRSDNQLTDSIDTPVLLRASDYPAQPVEWLWPEKIPVGKVSLIIGDPGLGKSLIALDIAARLSRAGTWPITNGARAENSPSTHSSLDIRNSSFQSPASTILLSANDDLADTIRPRLDAAGADPSRIYVLNSITDLRTEFAKLRAAIDNTPNCRLIIIDPINAYVGAGDSHFHSVVRKVLAPLAELAAEKRIAVVAIAHLRKTEGAAIYRAAGSMGFVASARVIWTVSRDPEDSSRQLLLPLKNNLTPAACGLAYSITSEPGSGAPTIVWHDTPTNKSSDHGLRRPEAADLHAVRIWLRKALANGPRSATDIKEEGAQFDFQERTLRRALHAIGGTTQNRGIIDGGWWWSLNSDDSFSGGRGSRRAEDESSRMIAQASHQPTDTHPQKTVPLCPLPRISPSATPAKTVLTPRVPAVESSLRQTDRSAASTPLVPPHPAASQQQGICQPPAPPGFFAQIPMQKAPTKEVSAVHQPTIDRTRPNVENRRFAIPPSPSGRGPE